MAIARPGAAHTANPALIERDEPLAALAGYLEEAAARSGRLVVIRGEAGIGKSAVLRAFLRSSPGTADVLFGTCDGVSTSQPFGPLEDMVAALGPGLRDLLDASASRAEIGRWLLDRMARGRTHVLVIEDVQWADDATLELVAYLARRLEALPLLVLVTYREGENPASSVTRVLGGLASLPVVRQLTLEPLSRDGIARLVGESDIDADEVHRITGGNPFYVKEVLAAGSGRIPLSVLDAVRARIAQLDPRGLRALQAVAILGVRAEPWLLAAIAGEDLIGVDDCLRVGLLTKADGVAFHHELTRMAVLQDLPVIHGIALHRRALAALERAGARDAARLAYHAEGAADRASVLRHASAAGKRALAMGALNEAASQFRRALRYADGLDDDGRAELLESLSLALHLVNEISGAYDAGCESVALRRSAGNREMLATDLSFLSLVAWVSERGHESWQAAREAVDLLEASGDSRELGMAYAALGRLGLSAGISEESRVASERAITIARRLDNPEVFAIAQATIGTLELLQGNEDGRARLEESLRIGRQAGLPTVVDRALNSLGYDALARRRLTAAEAYFADLEEHSERSEIERCSIGSARAEIALATGDWVAAERHAGAAFIAPRTDPVDRAIAMIVLARLAIRRGLGTVDDYLVEPIALVKRMDTTQIRWPLALATAERAWIAGTCVDALPDLRRAYVEACEHGDVWAIGDLGVWLWRAGGIHDLDERAALPYRLEFDGLTAEAAAEWHRLGVPYEEALCLAGSPDPDGVRRGHAILVGLGATAAAARVAVRLRELGTAVPRGPRTTTRSNPGGLTAREAEIAELLAGGLSNAEIAGRLVLSPRTVGHHVSAVLAKLDVPRRSAVAAAIGAVAIQR